MDAETLPDLLRHNDLAAQGITRYGLVRFIKMGEFERIAPAGVRSYYPAYEAWRVDRMMCDIVITRGCTRALFAQDKFRSSSRTSLRSTYCLDCFNVEDTIQV